MEPRVFVAGRLWEHEREPSAIASVQQYIERQPEHHAKQSFEEEYTSILGRAGVRYDPAYAFD